MTNVLVLGATGNVAQYFIDNFENVAPNDMQLTLLARRPRGLTRVRPRGRRANNVNCISFGATFSKLSIKYCATFPVAPSTSTFVIVTTSFSCANNSTEN